MYVCQSVYMCDVHMNMYMLCVQPCLQPLPQPFACIPVYVYRKAGEETRLCASIAYMVCAQGMMCALFQTELKRAT